MYESNLKLEANSVTPNFYPLMAKKKKKRSKKYEYIHVSDIP